MRVELDCSLMTGRAETHDYLKEKFFFPEYYGKNLDALYDLLTSAGEAMTIVLSNGKFIEENLGGYGSALLATIREAAEDNPNIELIEE
jgi:ribonuclease inhibitor